MKYKKEQFISPLARARGLGSAHHGTHHWLMQRVTSIAGIPLMAWLVWTMVDMDRWDHPTFSQWLMQPMNAILMIVAVLSMFHHAALGVQVIVEDYVHNEGIKMTALIGMKLFFFVAAAACIFSVLKISFGG